MSSVFILTSSAALLVLFTALVWRNLRWAVFLVALLLPTYLWRFDLIIFPTTFLEILLLIVILIWGFKYRGFWMVGKQIKLWRWPILLFLLAGVLSIVVAPDRIAALGLFRAYLLEPILFFFVCVSVLRDRKDVEYILGALILSGSVIVVLAILQRFGVFPIPQPWDTEYRVTSVYPFPNAVGLFLGPIITLAAAKIIETISQRSWKCIAWIAMFCLMVVAIILSQTEGAWIGVALGLVALGLLYRPLRLPTFAVIFIVGLLLATIPGPRETIMQKISFQDWSGKVRLTQWHESINMLGDHSIFGAGLSGYPAVFKPYHKATYIEIFQYPHNILLNFWSELGLLGVIAFGWILIIFFYFVIPTKSGIRENTDKKIIQFGLMAAVLTILIHGLVDVPYFKNDLAVQFWILMAAMTIVASLPKENSVIG